MFFAFAPFLFRLLFLPSEVFAVGPIGFLESKLQGGLMMALYVFQGCSIKYQPITYHFSYAWLVH